MTLKEVLTVFKKELKKFYPVSEINSFFFLIAEKELGFTKSKTLLHINEPMSMGESMLFHECLNRLKKHEPIQYILGETEFYGLNFKVTPATLIPRPETEELVDWIMTELLNHSKSNKSLLDIGTGSGCIAVSLAKNLPNFQVSAIDISKEALQIASENASANKVAVEFIQKDILRTNKLPYKYDVIVSNPPYVRGLEKPMMQKNVLDFEPSSALFVSNDTPLLFYSKIAQLAKAYLKESGLLYFEINEYLSKEVIQLLEEHNFSSISLKKDFFGKDRMVKCALGE